MEKKYVSDCCGIPIRKVYLYHESKGEIKSNDMYFICVCDQQFKVKNETKDGRPRYGCGLPCTPEEPEDEQGEG